MKKLAIVAAQIMTRGHAPFNDLDYEIWTISNYGCANWMKRVDAVIEVHKPEIYQDHPSDSSYWKWLQETETPIYLLEPEPLIKNVKRYPLHDIRDELLKKAWVFGRTMKIFCSSIDYALALAIYQGYKEIEIFGVEVGHMTEYAHMRPSFGFWVGFAAGHEIRIEVKCAEGIFHRPLYGQQRSVSNKPNAFLIPKYG